jgi:hypothetical protein
MFLKGKINPLPSRGDAAQMRRIAAAAKRIDESRQLSSMPIRGAQASGAGTAAAGPPASPAGGAR